MYLDHGSNKEEMQTLSDKFQSAFQMKRDDMFDRSWPAGRVVDQAQLKDNWTYYMKFRDVPILILHGEKDKEVKLY